MRRQRAGSRKSDNLRRYLKSLLVLLIYFALGLAFYANVERRPLSPCGG